MASDQSELNSAPGPLQGPADNGAFPLGSSYYPPFHAPEDWVHDVAHMAKAGLNVLRTAELIASWEWIEPSKGQFEFAWLDRIFEICQEHGLRILLGTGAGNPPIWLLDEYPDVQILSQDGVPYPTGTMWGWACIHHPGFRAEAERYLRALLVRYGGHPAVFGWQIHNEPGHPAIQRNPGTVDYYCYCAHSVAGFRAWLQARYGDIETLSDAWTCLPTGHRYRTWSQVRPPRSAPLAWGSPGAWLDWRQYIDESFADFIAWQNGIIKESDQDHPTMTNLAQLLDDDLGAVRGVDPWRYAEPCDVIGFDLYPLNRFKGEPFFSSLQLDYARSPALHADKPFWIPEIESGPIGEWVLGPSNATTGHDIRRYDLDCIGHGAKMLAYHAYRESDPMLLQGGGLVDLKGEPTERYQEAANLSHVIHSYADLFVEARPSRAQIGVLVDQRNAIANVGVGAGKMLLTAIKGVYYAYWSEDYPVEFITPELLAEGKGEGYRLLLMPFLTLVTPTCADAVARYVSGGGTVVAFAKCGMLNDKSWPWHDRPGGLTEVFGVRETHIAKSELVSLTPTPDSNLFKGVWGPLKGYWHRQDFALQGNTRVLATYPDGKPAITLNQFGQGRAILFGTHFDSAALAHDAWDHRLVFSNLAEMAGVRRLFRVEGGLLLEGHLAMRNIQQKGDPWGLFILINHAPEAVRARVHLAGLPRRTIVTDLFSQEVMNVTFDEGGLGFDMRLEGYDSIAFSIR